MSDFLTSAALGVGLYWMCPLVETTPSSALLIPLPSVQGNFKVRVCLLLKFMFPMWPGISWNSGVGHIWACSALRIRTPQIPRKKYQVPSPEIIYSFQPMQPMTHHAFAHPLHTYCSSTTAMCKYQCLWAKIREKMWLLPLQTSWSFFEGKREITGKREKWSREYKAVWFEDQRLLAGGMGRYLNRVDLDLCPSTTWLIFISITMNSAN